MGMDKNLRDTLIREYPAMAEHLDSAYAPNVPVWLAWTRLVNGEDSQADRDLIVAWAQSL